MNSLTLAYLGDAVYELYVRQYLISKGVVKVKLLQKESIEYVSAESQAKILSQLWETNFLTAEEKEIIKRGRNTHSHTKKNTDLMTYKWATGFESLIGYLYLNDKKRLDILMKEVLK